MDPEQKHKKQDGNSPIANADLQEEKKSSECTADVASENDSGNEFKDLSKPNIKSIDESQKKIESQSGDVSVLKLDKDTVDIALNDEREIETVVGETVEAAEPQAKVKQSNESNQDEDLVQQSDGSNPLLSIVRDNGEIETMVGDTVEAAEPQAEVKQSNEREIETVVSDSVETVAPQAEVKQSNKSNQDEDLVQKSDDSNQPSSSTQENSRLRDDNGTLKEKINSLEAENSGFQEKLNRLEQENNDLQRELKSVKDQCRSLNPHYGEMSVDQFIRTLHKELKNVNGERNELIQRMKVIGTTHQEQLETAEKSIASLKKQVENVTNDNENVKRRMKDMGTTHQEQLEAAEKSIASLKKQVDNVTNDNENVKRRYTDISKKETSYQNDVRKLTSEIKSQTKAIELLNADNKTLEDKITKQNNLIGRFDKDKQRLRSFEEVYPTVLEENKKLKSAVQDLQPYKEVHSVLQQQLLEQDQRLIKCQDEVEKLKEEKQTLLLRLSKVAGANLTHNNPNIADLSDDKRPTKLAEEFSELYDNEWTDAFEELNISDEEQKTTYMLNLLQRANQLCRDVSTKHNQDIRNSISTLTIRMLSAPPVRKHKEESFSDETSHETNQYYEDNVDCQRESDVNDNGDKTDSGELGTLKRDKEKSTKKGNHEVCTTILQPSESGKYEAMGVKRNVTTRDETIEGVKKETTREEINKMTGEETDGKSEKGKDETTESEIKQTTKGKGDKTVQKRTNRTTASTTDVTVKVERVEPRESVNDETNEGDEDDSPRSEKDQQIELGLDLTTKPGQLVRSNSTKNEKPKCSKPETIQSKSKESFEPNKTKTKEDDKDLMFQSKNNDIVTDDEKDSALKFGEYEITRENPDVPAVIEDKKEDTNKSGNNATTKGEKDASQYSGKHEALENEKGVITENANGESVITEKHISDGKRKVKAPSERHETTEYHNESGESEENESFKGVHPDKTGVQTDGHTNIEDSGIAGVKTDVITKTENPDPTKTNTEGKGGKSDVTGTPENSEATEVRTDANTSTEISETCGVKAGISTNTEYSDKTEMEEDITTNTTSPETTENKQDVISKSEHNENSAGKTDGTTNNENHETAEDKTDLTRNSKIHKTTEIEREVTSNSRQHELTGVKSNVTLNSGHLEAKKTDGESEKNDKDDAYKMETDSSNTAQKPENKGAGDGKAPQKPEDKDVGDGKAPQKPEDKDVGDGKEDLGEISAAKATNVEIDRVQAADSKENADPGKIAQKPEDKDVGDGKAPQRPEDKDVGDGKAPQKPEDKEVGDEKASQKPEDKDVGDGKEDLGEISAAKEMKLKSNFELLRNEQKKTIMDARRFFEKELAAELEKAGTDIIIREQGIHAQQQETVVLYIQKCINICWSMYRHDPPVHVEFSDVTENIPFDTNKFKPYTKSGKYIDHIVWPSLQLHEGGPMLCKGVAQGRQVKK